MHEGVSHTGYLAHGNSKVEIRGRSKHNNNDEIVLNTEGRTVGTKGKSPKQGLTSAKDLTIELSESMILIHSIKMLLKVVMKTCLAGS